jgi:lysophospholipase L1-like esterase
MKNLRTLVAVALVSVGMLTALQTVAKRKPAKKKAPAITAAQRAAARQEIERRMAAVKTGVENPGALAGYFSALDKVADEPVHILQFGDSHTASDDWVNALRLAAQAKYGDGGPGFVQAGHPYKGYRRFDAAGASSAGWKTDGNTAHSAVAEQGLSHVSILAASAGQTVHLSASGTSLGLFYLKQPGGGQFVYTVDEGAEVPVETDGELGPGESRLDLTPGPHEVALRTVDAGPVRLFGWTLDNPKGVTAETLGINGAQASILLNANEAVWAAEVAARNPALVILAYGTNEAISRAWTAEQYRADVTEAVARVRRAAPKASILLVGPPDCGKAKALPHLAEVIEIQRELSGALNTAFWDWRMHMGGPRVVALWVRAGLSQGDYIHLTGDGYRLIGNTLFDHLELARAERAHAEHHE